MRSRKRPCQPKTRSDFLAAPVHMAPPGRQKSERAFCLFGGVFLRPACRAVCRGGRSCAACRCCGGFCARCPVFFLPVCRCLVPGLRLSAVFCLACAACLPFGRRRLCFRLAGSLPLLCLARAAGACLPFARRALCVHGFSLLFFLFSLRPRRASTFFRKESRQRFARGRGSAPFEPPFLRPAANLFLFRAAGRLSGHSAANRRQIRETLEKPRSRAQLFKRFCAKEDACTLSPISPLFLAAGRLSAALRAANRRLIRETLEKPRSKAQLFKRFCALGERVAPRFTYSWKFGVGFCPAAGNRNQAFSPPGKTEAQRGLAPRKNRVHAQLGKGTNQVRGLPGAAARLAHRRCARRRRGLFPCPGKQEPGVRHAPGTSRGRARRGEEKDRERELPGAAARGRSRQGKPLCGQPTHYKLHRG